jgi:hypothetical protein
MVSAVFVVLYLGAIVVLHGGIAPLRQMWELLPDLLPWKRLRTSTPAIASSERLEHAVAAER